MNFQEVFTNRLKLLRVHKELTQEQLAETIDESRTLVNHWETGKRFPGMAKLISLADFFGVSLDYLVGRSDNPKMR